MFYVVYIDVLFLVNFFMDFIILTATGKMLRIRTKLLRRILGAMLGATCYCITLCLPWESRKWGSITVWLIAAVMMGSLVFSLRRGKELFRFLVVFHAAAFFLGGTVTTLYYHTRLGYYLRKAVKGDAYAQTMTGLFTAIVILSCIFGKIAAACMRQRQRERNLYYEVELYFGNRNKRVTALLDTGNHLKEPISHKPVILMDMTLAGELLEEETVEAVRTFYRTGDFYTTENMGEMGTDISKIRLIPYHSIGKSRGLLAALPMDSLKIQMEQGNMKLTDVWTALSEEPVAAKGRYQVILNAELVEQGEL